MRKEKGIDAIKNYIDDFIDSDFFQGQVQIIRKKFNLPKRGFVITKEEKNRLEHNRQTFDGPIKLSRISGKLSIEIYKIINCMPIDGFELHLILKIYLIYNIKFIDLWDFVFKEDNFNLVRIADWKKEIVELEDYYQNYTKGDGKKLFDILKEEAKNYPIILRINPQTSRNALVDYIEKNWSRYIAPTLLLYRKKTSKLGKLRNKDEQRKKIYNFIYKNRKKPYEKIVSLTMDKFPGKISQSIDAGSVGKIISLEKERRS